MSRSLPASSPGTRYTSTELEIADAITESPIIGQSESAIFVHPLIAFPADRGFGAVVLTARGRAITPTPFGAADDVGRTLDADFADDFDDDFDDALVFVFDALAVDRAADAGDVVSNVSAAKIISACGRLRDRRIVARREGAPSGAARVIVFVHPFGSVESHARMALTKIFDCVFFGHLESRLDVLTDRICAAYPTACAPEKISDATLAGSFGTSGNATGAA